MKKALNVINVNKVLHEEWDPIGCGVPEDEYQAYANIIALLLKQGLSENMIQSYMIETQTNTIGLRVIDISKIQNTLNKFVEYKWL